MFSFFKSKPSTKSASQSSPAHHRAESRVAEPWRTNVAEGGYDDVNLESGVSTSSDAAASRNSFSIPTATDASFVGGGRDAVYPPLPSTSSTKISSTNGYPSLRSTFTRLETLLGDSSPVLYDTLSLPLLSNSPSLVSLLHAVSPYHLPSSVIESYLIHDGQDPFSSNNQGLFFGLYWLPLEQVETEWKFWRRFEQAGGGDGMFDAFSARTEEGRRGGGGRIHPYTMEDGDESGVGMDGMSSFPPGWVRSRYSHPGWLPLLTDRAGNYIGVDLDPPPPSASNQSKAGTFGQSGQVIAFGREMDEKVVLFPGDSAGGWGRWLAAFVDDLERGEFARLSEGRGERKRSNWVGGETSGSSDEDDTWQDGDGLGDVDYLEGDRYGDDLEGSKGGSGKLWTLRKESRRWLENEGHGGIIGALAERSRKQWRSVGVGLPSTPIPSAERPSRLPLSVTIPEREAGQAVEAEPESAATERPSSPQLQQSSDSSRPSIESLTASLSIASSESSLANESDVELKVSPPSPKLTRPPSSMLQQAAEITSPVNPRSPDYLHDGRPRTARPLGAPKRERRRPPPPAPMALDLPTMADLESPLPYEGGTHYSSPYGGDRLSSDRELSPARTSFGTMDRGVSTPTRDTLLAASTASTTALVEGEDVTFSPALSDRGFEVIVDAHEKASRGGPGTPPPPSDQPYANGNGGEARS